VPSHGLEFGVLFAMHAVIANFFSDSTSSHRYAV